MLIWLLFSAAPDPPVTEIRFVMWKPHQPEAWDRLLADFHRAHPEIRVIVEVGPHSATELHTLLVTKLLNRDTSIDVFLLDVIWPTEFAKFLEPLDDLLPDRDAFFPGTVDACTVDGRLVAVPFNIDAGVLYYRSDLLAKYGFAPPKTWDELIAQSLKIVAGEGDPALSGYVGQFDRYEGLVCNLLELGGGDPADPRGVEIAKRLFATVMPRSALSMREPQSRAMFLQGECAFHRSWPSTWKIANDPSQSKIAGRVGIAPLPGGVSTLGGWQLGLAAHSEKKEAAKAFIRYMISPDAQRNLTLWTSQTHSRMASMEDPEVLAKFPHFAELRKVLEGAKPRPKLANYHEYSDRLQADLYRDISGEGASTPWWPTLLGVGLLAALIALVARRRG